jgi:hypothetical protein
MPDAFTHPSNLMVPPLADFDMQPGLLGPSPQYLSPSGPHPLLPTTYATTKEFQGRGPRNPVHFDFIPFGYVEPWMKQGVGQGTVVGKQQEPLGVKIQSPHGKEARPSFREEIQNRGAPSGVRGGGNESRRLVKQNINAALGAGQSLPIDP